ncbi:hypothetical protein SUGI_1159930 [Cryptomeria japonica]|uniref:uncharacterized protein LOC131071581 n=1 Tax=Cryptomeria japonica TaxID=3369 RepID=UPI002414B1DE|nr:uncharacterized protein LOC131071581 [Cryptomeria japonica]GLJ54141.1 hypothetical protein SUGI_1159930 [Cryptomeria japonica]
MGCVCSKQAKKHTKERTISVTNHMVALTSSTLGVLDLGPSKAQQKEGESESGEQKELNVSDEVIKSKKWTEKSVTQVESAERVAEVEPMTINAWELMQGLDEEDGGVDQSKRSSLEEEKVKFTPKKAASEVGNGRHNQGQQQRFGKENGMNVRSGKMRMNEVSTSSPLRELNVNDNCSNGISPEIGCRGGSGSVPCKRVSKRGMTDLKVASARRLNSKIRLSMDLITEPQSPLFSPQLVATLEKALENLSEEEWNFIRKSEGGFHHGEKKKCKDEDDPLESFEVKCPPGGADAVVLYTTTLRGIRKTFEDCNNVRDTLASYGICISERDVSMHLDFRNELRKLMGKLVTVPRLFIKGRYIGGADEVLRIHEEGELGHLLQGIPTHMPGAICDGCGGVRFVPCLECSGSCKLVNEENRVVRCPECNENGLIQCPICC